MPGFFEGFVDSSLGRSGCFLQELEGLAGRHLALPTRHVLVGVAVVGLLEFKQPEDEVSQGGHDLSGTSAGHLGGILTQGDIPSVMGADFAGAPMVANGLGQLLGGAFIGGEAGGIEAVFLGALHDLAATELLAFTPEGNKLPASTQAGLLGVDAHSLQAPSLQPPVLLDPP